MKTFNYGGRSYHVDDNHVFVMELGRYENKYSHLYTFNTLDEAIPVYENYHVSDGYKKRLKVSMPDNEIVIAKQISKRGE